MNRPALNSFIPALARHFGAGASLPLPTPLRIAHLGRALWALVVATLWAFAPATVLAITPVAPAISVFNGASTATADARVNHGPAYDFGYTGTPSNAKVQTFTIQNTGTANLGGLAVTLGGGTAPDDFTLGALGATTLAPGATATFTVALSPTGTGTRSTAVTITSDDAATPSFVIPVTGSGVFLSIVNGRLRGGSGIVVNGVPYRFILDTNMLQLDNLKLGTSLPPFYADTNAFTAASRALVAQVLQGPYGARPTWISENPDTNACSIYTMGIRTGSAVAWAGTGVDRRDLIAYDTAFGGGTLQSCSRTQIPGIVANSANRPTVQWFPLVGDGDIALFAGNGSGGPELVDNGARQNLGATQTYTIKNVGSATNLTGLAVSVGGLNADKFTVDTTGMLTTLAPGDTTTFTVTPVAGPYGAVIQIASSDPDESVFRLNVGAALPTVIAPIRVSAGTTGAILGGTVMADGGTALTARGVVLTPLGATGDQTGPSVSKLATGTPATGVFTVDVTGLTPDTRYQFQAFALNAVGTTYSNPGVFTTGGPAGQPGSITVVPPTTTTPGSITLRDDLTFHIAATGTNQVFVVLDEWVTSTGVRVSLPASGSFNYSLNGGAVQTLPMSGLTDNLAGWRESPVNENPLKNLALNFGAVTVNDGYFFPSNTIAFQAGDIFTVKSGTWVLPASASAAQFNPQATQTFSGNVFLTDINGDRLDLGAQPATLPTVITPVSSGITTSAATLGGNVIGDGGATITERGIVLARTAINADPNIGGTGVTKITAAGTTGVFTVNATGLNPTTGYSFKAFATTVVGTSYTGVATFTTGAVPTPPEIAVSRVFYDEDDGSPYLSGINSGGSANLGTVGVGGGGFIYLFQIDNTGTGPLNLTGTPKVALSGSPDISVSIQPPVGSIAAGGSTQFTLAFNPTSGGLKTATLTITNNDSDEGTFTIMLGGSGFVPNATPVAGADVLNRPNTGRVAKVLKSVLLANDTDADLDALSLTAVGGALPAGATVAIVGNFVVYTAPAAGSGNGSFTYTLRDSPGGHAVTGTVTVVATTLPGDGVPNAARLTHQGSDFVLTFLGVPGRTYGLQYTTNAIVPCTWNDFVPPVHLPAPDSGVLTYTDVNPTDPVRLYRLVLLP